MFEISVIIPCYNEERNLIKIVEAINHLKSNNQIKIEFIIVNNGSTDNTKDILKNLSHEEYLKYINLERNAGYGGGIIAGIKKSKAKIIAWTHGDIQCDIGDVIIGYNKFKKDLDLNKSIVKGFRVNRRFIDSFFSKLMEITASIVFLKNFKEINAQPKLFNKKLFKFFKNSPNDFSLDLFLLYTAKKNNLNINEFPVYYKKREYGYSKGGDSFIGKFKLSLRSLKYIFKLRFNL